MAWKRGEAEEGSILSRFKARLRNTFVFDYISENPSINKHRKLYKTHLKAEKSSRLKKFLENKRNKAILLTLVVLLAVGVPALIYNEGLGAAIFEPEIKSNRIETSMPSAIGDDDPGAGKGVSLPEIPGADEDTADEEESADEPEINPEGPPQETITDTGFGKGTNRGSSSTSGSHGNDNPSADLGNMFFGSFFGIFNYFKNGIEVFAEDTSFDHDTILQIRKNNLKLLDIEALFENADVNISGLVIEQNETQIAVDFSQIPSGHVGDTVALYLPDNGTGLYFCRNITTLSQVNMACPNAVVFNQTEIEAGTTKAGVTATTDGTYYKIEYS
ncbi:hypothetical protein GF371_04120 [Candidatus Woesearchaeota archaeon]|nr:hypothetical protein [Candidatus Woesearchaeota archaeon]